MVQAMSKGRVPMAIEALTDSYSIFSYLAAAHLKLPAEKGTYYHLAYLREKLVSTLIGSYTWVDTRDMVADGLTKGRADRTALIKMMHGSFVLDHIAHEYKEPSTNTRTSSQYVQREAAAAAAATPLRQPDAVLDYKETEEYLIHAVYSTSVEQLDWMSGGDGDAVTACSEGHGSLNHLD